MLRFSLETTLLRQSGIARGKLNTNLFIGLQGEFGGIAFPT